MSNRSEYKRRLGLTWIAEGKCKQCGARPPAPRRMSCQVCLDKHLLAARRAREKNPTAFKDLYQKRKMQGLCVSCGAPDNPRGKGLRCEPCALVERQRAVRIKHDVMQKYGGSCFCCGEERIAFLTLDHTNNDGAELRRSGEHSGGSRFYKKLRRAPIDPALRVSCFNCNCARRVTGVCPHKDTTYFDAALAKKPWDRHDTEQKQQQIKATHVPVDKSDIPQRRRGGRQLPPELKNGNHRILTENEVKQVFTRRAAGQSQRAIGQAMGMAQSRVSLILCGKRLPDVLPEHVGDYHI